MERSSRGIVPGMETQELLLVTVEGPGTQAEAAICERLVQGLLEDRAEWTVRPPTFLNEPDENANAVAGPEDEELWMVGLFTYLPGAEPHAEERVRDDLEVIAAAVSRTAREHGLAFEIEFRGEAVDWLDGSKADDGFVRRFYGET